tara:strand:+ start:154741 stop:155235 length:495 start_codon:yes stop_codon:yes gene_type:complete
MIWKGAMKYPVLITGVIMFVLFLSNEKTKIWWNEISMRYIPSTCKSLEDRMQSKLPDHWKLRCANKDSLILRVKVKENPIEPTQSRALYYRILANEIKSFALMANPETLVHLLSFKLYLKGKYYRILAQTDGEALVQLREIKDKERMANHLKLTVKVKELPKDS